MQVIGWVLEKHPDKTFIARICRMRVGKSAKKAPSRTSARASAVRRSSIAPFAPAAFLRPTPYSAGAPSAGCPSASPKKLKNSLSGESTIKVLSPPREAL